MPRKHGGSRQGSPGRAYSNRTDLNTNRQPVQAAAGQAYGERQAQEQAQRAMPLPAAPPVPASPPPPAPGSFGAFTRPTENPNEPLTAGLAMGPGAGPEAVVGPWGGLSEDDRLVAELRGVYAAFPSRDIARLLEYAERRGSGSLTRDPNPPTPNRLDIPGAARGPWDQRGPRSGTATGGVGGAVGLPNPMAGLPFGGSQQRGRSAVTRGARGEPITSEFYYGPPGVTPREQGATEEDIA